MHGVVPAEHKCAFVWVSVCVRVYMCARTGERMKARVGLGECVSHFSRNVFSPKLVLFGKSRDRFFCRIWGFFFFLHV